MGILIRAGMVLTGLLMILISLQRSAGQKPINEVPIDMSAEELAALADDSFPVYIRTDAGVDRDNAMYSTGLDQPTFALRPTNVVYPLPLPSSSAWADATSLRGTTVSYHGALLPFGAYLAQSRVRKGQAPAESDAVWVYGIATTAVAAGKLIIVSPRFESVHDPALDLWQEKTRFSGPLIALRSLDENEPDFAEYTDRRNGESFEHVSAIAELFKPLGLKITQQTLVLIDLSNNSPEPFHEHGAAFAPLRGSEHRVLVRLNQNDAPDDDAGPEDSRGSSQSIVGVAEEANRALSAGALRLFNARHDHFVLIHTDRSPQEYNQDRVSFIQTGLTVGGGLLIAALGIWFIIRFDIRPPKLNAGPRHAHDLAHGFDSIENLDRIK